MTETIVATTIIIIVFAIVTVSLNNVLSNKVLHNTSVIENKIQELIYTSRNKKIQVPNVIEDGDWIIHVYPEQFNSINYTVFEAMNKKLKKEIIKAVIANEYEEDKSIYAK
ncbi:hypothetical protein [Winogradskyella sp.]|uniref:hypothetical protein n=1 Tax=Winogradskyella sp. TaxID=1883156 RepID=UPI003AB59A17